MNISRKNFLVGAAATAITAPTVHGASLGGMSGRARGLLGGCFTGCMMASQHKDELPWLKFTARADSSVAMTTTGSPATISLEYSRTGASGSWLPFSDTGGTTVSISSGDSVYIRASGTNGAISASDSAYRRFSLTGALDCSGNICSLLDRDCATTDIPNWCFVRLFRGLSALKSFPDIVASSIGSYAFKLTFGGCGISRAPEIITSQLSAYAFFQAFYMATRITSPMSTIPSCTIPSNCFYSAFEGCVSLDTLPALPAVSIDNRAYGRMFYGCTNLSGVVEIAATSFAGRDNFREMFVDTKISSCTLHNTQMPTRALDHMFSGCSQLSELNVDFTAWGNVYASDSWVNGVAASGRFVCPTALGTDATITRGISGCPTGWTVVNK